MKRTRAFASIAVLSFLPTSISAAPPAIAPARVSVVPVESPLSAAVAGDRALIAHHYAPVHHQAVDRSGKNGLEGRADYRSEERRVGKEWRCRWWSSHE